MLRSWGSQEMYRILIVHDKRVYISAHKRHLNQMRKSYLDEQSIPEQDPMLVLYGVFNILMPQIAPETRLPSKRKRQSREVSDVNPHRK